MSDFQIEDGFAVVDRSTLEAYAEGCPRQARMIDSGRVLNANRLMEVGNEVHSCVGGVISEYVDSSGTMGVSDICDSLEQRIARSRPDLQRDTINALRSSVWGIAKYIRSVHWQNILRFDGGTGEQSGQLSYDLPEFGLRVTSELDFVHAGPSPEVIHELDWKSGWKRNTSDDVAESFQFGLHGLLLLHNYPDIEAANVRIWDTRFNTRTYSVLFKRFDMLNLDGRVRRAAENYVKYHKIEPEQVDPYPMLEYCEDCPAAALCDQSRMPFNSPDEIVRKLIAAESTVKALKKLAAEHVKQHGDIVTDSGSFGIAKPKKARAPTMAIYSKQSPAEESSEE